MNKIKLISLLSLVICLGIISGFFIMGTANNKNEEANITSKQNIISEIELEDMVAINTQYLDDLATGNYQTKIKYDPGKMKMGPFTDFRPQSTNNSTVNTAVNKENITEKKEPAVPPFTLVGIVGNEFRRLAIINSNQETTVCKETDWIADYKIIEIKNDRLLLTQDNILFELALGRDSFENKNE
ncbi:MAG: hypothetical protein ACOCQB_01425 [Halanaerobiaceae bacterium]